MHQQAGELRLHGWLNRERMPVRVQSRVLPHRQQLHRVHDLFLASQLRGFRLSGWRREQQPRLCTVAPTAAALAAAALATATLTAVAAAALPAAVATRDAATLSAAVSPAAAVCAVHKPAQPLHGHLWHDLRGRVVGN